MGNGGSLVYLLKLTV